MLYLLVQQALCSYILTSNGVGLHKVANIYGASLIATVNDLSFYKVSDEDYTKNINVFDNLFDVEVETTYHINQVFVQYPSMDHLVLQRDSVPWHLDRISKRHLPLDGTFNKDSCLTNKDITVNTYVVDTGVDVNHPEFGGRVKWLDNFTDDGEDTDSNGHGTHCAGLIGSTTYGVCKDANIFAIKVLDGQGSGSMSGVLQGIELAFKLHLSQGNSTRSIVSMSLGGGYSLALNRAIESMLSSSDTFYVTVAAGNENSDACDTSPASAKGVITIMASDMHDNRAYFSNYGKCADIYSPGVDIISTYPGGRSVSMSGTSMATPIFAGTMNHYINKLPKYNNKMMKKYISRRCTRDVLVGNPDGTKNLLVYLA